jgi:hypothetical protein
MAAHSPEHTAARLASTFETYVSKAEDDIMADLRHPRRTGLTVNDDRPARWAAAQKLIALGRVIVVLPEAKRLTRRPPPNGGPRRERMEVRIRLPNRTDSQSEDETI